jgi:hypothetical protein
MEGGTPVAPITVASLVKEEKGRAFKRQGEALWWTSARITRPERNYAPAV